MVFRRRGGVNLPENGGVKRIIRTAFGVSATAILGGLIERELIAAPHYHGERSDHFDGRKFFNAETGEHGRGSFFKWMFERERGYWRDWVDDPPGPPPPARVDGGRMRVTFINHATMLLQCDNVNILTDPIWSERCSPSAKIGPKRHRAPGIRFRDLPRIDVVLLSHNHYDHLDLPTLHALRRTHRPRIITPLGNDLFLKKHGIRNVTALDWWQAWEGITLVPSRHFCSRGLSDRDANLWGGFVISGSSGHAYFAGDTGFGEHFALIAQRFPSIRVAMLPIGAFLPRWFMKPVHMSPDEAVSAHAVLGATTSIPMHYGTFDLGDDGELEPLEQLHLAIEEAGNPNIVELGHGEGREV
jgi:L-ascorbate metabolism protein UlaG (beta-lactamase superfamily)